MPIKLGFDILSEASFLIWLEIFCYYKNPYIFLLNKLSYHLYKTYLSNTFFERQGNSK